MRAAEVDDLEVRRLDPSCRMVNHGEDVSESHIKSKAMMFVGGWADILNCEMVA